jgi:D-ribulokinase
MPDANRHVEPVWLGIDLGTQSVRALAVSGSGKVVGAGSQKLSSRRDGPRHEQDPQQWWDCTAAACRAALNEAAAGAVQGVAVDGTSGTLLLVDVAGRPLTPALMYDDTRATDEANRASAAGAAVWQSLGYNRMQPAWALPKLLWLLHCAGGVPRGARLSHQADFINRRLVGHDVPADSSNALKTGYDTIRERWPLDAFDVLGVPESILPAVVRSGSVLGTVCAEAAAATGIPAGTPVIAGMTDGCAAQLGAGALSPGSWNSVLGTTLVLKGVSANPVSDPAGVVYSHRSPDGNWLPGGASSVGAGILAATFPGRDLAALDALAAGREPATAVTYPLAGRGERFPFNAPGATGFTLGEPADEADRYASILQGVAFIERLAFDSLHRLGADVGGPLSLTGGGAQSRYWCQLRADVLGRAVALPENAEPALGMAVLAAAACGRRPLAAVAAEMVTLRETIEPRADRLQRWHEPYLRLINELASRGWLSTDVATHAKERSAR